MLGPGEWDWGECGNGGQRAPAAPISGAKRGTAGFFVVLDGVVDDQQVGAFAGDGATHARGRHAAFAAVEVPAVGGA